MQNMVATFTKLEHEKQIRDIADEIKHLFGDEVIIYGSLADEFLRERRTKSEHLS